MPTTRFQVRNSVPPDISGRLTELCSELGVPEGFPPEVLAEAEALASGGWRFETHADLTDVPFVTIDPPSSMDLDQAVHIEACGEGFLVSYAIADVGAWIPPGGRIDAEAQRRGQTYYLPSGRAPLHPPALSEAAASLLADGAARPAMVWRLRLDSEGSLTGIELCRAMVRSRAKLSYEQVQRDLDGGQAAEPLRLLREVGLLRQQLEAARGGVSLNLPQQEVESTPGGWRLVYRRALPVEDWNAQVSLLAGHAAATLMLDAGTGVLRTLPQADELDVARLRRIARSLRIDWNREMGYPEFVRSLDPELPRHLAMSAACVTLFRGAAYTLIDGRVSSGQVSHGALAMPYAHTTAPLRRLVDRYVLEVCYAVANGRPVPEWAAAALPGLPETMAASE
ncbi:MAG: RNB domain-containing ribonuclease [Propionibacteriaceae bacterium]|nr:RNB domain-containing ribonuclease [Propionibacteriaceae bacterium]